MNKLTFENFLRDEHFKIYHGSDDDMSDAFDNWITELQADDFLAYCDEYASEVVKEIVPKKKSQYEKLYRTNYEQGIIEGYNNCLDQILSNLKTKLNNK
jgi:hypothetical protein